MQTEIELNFSREIFEEIYFKNKQGDYFRSPTTKSAFRKLLITTVLLILVLVFSFQYNTFILPVFILVFFVLALYQYVNACRVLSAWRKQIDAFIDREQKYKSSRLILSDDSFLLLQDDKRTIERWNNFSSAKIHDDFMLIEGKENYLFPKKSMAAENYDVLKNIISDKFTSDTEAKPQD